MKTLNYIFLFAIIFFIGCNKQNEVAKKQYEIVWSDEFEYQGTPDSKLWSFELGNGCPTLCGYGNNEQQYYTNDSKNARVEDGRLILEAFRNEGDTLKRYTSGKIITKQKGDWTYGYVEVRAKLPSGRGTWPAIWMLPTEWKYGDWPKSGEIDIMEHVGYDYGNVHGTVHTEAYNHKKGTEKGKIFEVSDPDQYHLYAINWTPEKIDFFVDSTLYNTFSNNGQGSDYWPYDQKYHLILNIAVGGDWGGKEGIDDSIWPQRMEIDYVRVYNFIDDKIAEK